MALNVEGTLHEIFDIVEVSERFKKREFVLEISNGNYPQFPKFQVTQDRCALLDSFGKGDSVNVHFNLDGRPYDKPDGTRIYFTNLSAWKIEAVSQSQNGPTDQAPPSNGGGGQSPPPERADEQDIDDLPF